MNPSPNPDELTPDELRTLVAQLLTAVDAMGRKIHRNQTIIKH